MHLDKRAISITIPFLMVRSDLCVTSASILIASESPGVPCNAEGIDLPPDTPPQPPPAPKFNDYTPYDTRVEFELADFFF